MKVALELGDITQYSVDAIVAPANNDLILGGDVSGDVRRNGGDVVQEECNRVAPIPLGEAVVTGAGALKAKMVIHCAVMPLGLWADARSIRLAVGNSLKRAEERGVTTLALPAVGTGTGNFPAHKSAMIVFDELEQYVKSGRGRLTSITIVCADGRTLEEYSERFKEFQTRVPA